MKTPGLTPVHLQIYVNTGCVREEGRDHTLSHNFNCDDDLYVSELGG